MPDNGAYVHLYPRMVGYRPGLGQVARCGHPAPPVNHFASDREAMASPWPRCDRCFDPPPPDGTEWHADA